MRKVICGTVFLLLMLTVSSFGQFRKKVQREEKTDKVEESIDFSKVYQNIRLKPGKAIKMADFKPVTAFPARRSLAMYGKEWIFIQSSLKFSGDFFVEGILAEFLEVEIGGHELKFQKDKVVRFHPNGTFKEGHPVNVVTKNGAKFKDYVYYYNDIFCGGRLMNLPTINGAEYFNTLYFHPNGNVASGFLTKGYAYGSLILPASARVTYDENGFVTTVNHTNADFLGKYKFKERSYTYFHPEEKIVRFGVLAMDANIEGKIYKAGTRVTFDKQGKLVKAD